MNQERLKQLLEFYSEDPDDPFTNYALATEYKEFEPQKALELFEKLLENHPQYVPTYYHLAHLYLDLENDEKAKRTFEKGIEIASQNEDSLALRELKSAYDEFMMDY